MKLDDMIFKDALIVINEEFLREITDNEVKLVRLQEDMEKLNDKNP